MNVAVLQQDMAKTISFCQLCLGCAQSQACTLSYTYTYTHIFARRLLFFFVCSLSSGFHLEVTETRKEEAYRPQCLKANKKKTDYVEKEKYRKKNKTKQKNPTPIVVMLAVIILCFSPTGRCPGGKRYVEEQDLRGNAAGLHKAWLGPSQVGNCSNCVFSLLNVFSLPLSVERLYRDNKNQMVIIENMQPWNE